MKYVDVFNAALELAPLELSQKMVEALNGYDNSGIIIETDREISKVLVTLDLTPQSAEYAVANGYELIITHHPAIYTPIKRLDFAGNRALTTCALHGVGVISLHLNLDVAKGGIDQSMAEGLGAKKSKVLTWIDKDLEAGYGRLFEIDRMTLGELAEIISKNFETNNVMVYGDRRRSVKKVASFCGAGCDLAELELARGADVIVSADFKHHVIREALNRGVWIVQMTHYASESYGLKIFAAKLTKKLSGLKVSYFGAAEF